MTRLPNCSGRSVVRALENAGFTLVRITGSHHIMRNPGPPQRTVTIPVHGRDGLKRATLSSIIRQSNLSIDEFVRLL